MLWASFLLANALSIIGVFLPIQVGATFSALSIVFLFLIAVRNSVRVNHIVWGCYLFFTLEICSIVNYLLNEFALSYSRPEIILASISYLLIPQSLFFFIGLEISKSKSVLIENMTALININIVMLAVGLILHFWRPDFYITYLQRSLGEVFDSYGGLYPRFVGYLDSMAIGVICSSLVAMVLFTDLNALKKSFFIIFLLVAAALTLQRGSYLSVALVLAIFLIMPRRIYRGISENDRITKKIIIFFFVSVIFFLTIISDGLENFQTAAIGINEMSAKLDPLGAIAERSSPWLFAVELANQYPIGVGIGVLSHKNAEYNPFLVADGNYFRILGELGYVGLFLFLFLFAGSVVRAFKHGAPNVYWPLLVFGLQAIGTNVFDLYYSSFVFWLLIGISAGLSFSTKKEHAIKPKYDKK